MLADPIVKDVGEEEEPDRPADLKYPGNGNVDTILFIAVAT